MTTRKVLNGKPYAGNLHRLIAVCVAFSALAASAYLAPVEERCGVRVEIGSFPQKTERPGKNPYAWPLGVTEVEAGAPRTFPVTLENRTGMPIAGELEVWMNDDWDVSGPQGPLKLDVWMNDGWDVAYPKGPIVLESGEKKELLFTGKEGGRPASGRGLHVQEPPCAASRAEGVRAEARSRRVQPRRRLHPLDLHRGGGKGDGRRCGRRAEGMGRIHDEGTALASRGGQVRLRFPSALQEGCGVRVERLSA